MKFWYAFVAAFFLVWTLLVAGSGLWPQALAHWPMAVVMVLGSIVAGSTPMGGGSVSFPVLALAFGQPPGDARDFALAIQAVGMTSAMVFIAARRIPVHWRVLAWTAAGATAGMTAGTLLVAPRVPAPIVKLLFACLWMSFAVLILAKNSEICAFERSRRVGPRAAAILGLAVGAAGGVVASIIGVGIEMMLYTTLVLLYRCDPNIAVPTAVSGMAIGSVIGAALHVAIGDVPQEVFFNWLAAAPVVIVGAPFGAYLVTVVPRIRMLYFVAALCVLQFVWTLRQVAPGSREWSFVAAALLVANVAFYVLYRVGRNGPARAMTESLS